MSKSSEIPRRRRLAFDPLEGRQLLNGGYSQAPLTEMAPGFSGLPAGGVSVYYHDGFSAGTGNILSPQGPTGWGPAAWVEQHGADPDAGLLGPAVPTFGGGFALDIPAWDRTSVTVVETAWTAQSGLMAPPSSFVISFTLYSPASPTANGWATGTSGGGVTSAAPAWLGNANNSGNAASGTYDSAYYFAQTRTPDLAPPLPPVFASPVPLSALISGMRERTEAPESPSALAGSLSVSANPGAPGAPAMSALPANVAAAIVSPTPGPQTPPSGAVVAAQPHALGGDADAAGGDRTIALATGSVTRGVNIPPRAANLGGALVATTLSQVEPASPSSAPGTSTTDLDDAAPLPRGADLIAEALPFAGDSLERSLEDFVRQLKAVDVGGIVTQGPTPIVVASIALAGAAASAVVVREVVRRRTARRNGPRVFDSRGRELALSFPELPRSWSEKR
jgi:hypothetical protein